MTSLDLLDFSISAATRDVFHHLFFQEHYCGPHPTNLILSLALEEGEFHEFAELCR